MAKEKKTTETAEPGFEAGLGELEAVVKQLESADLPLEKALELFERGVALSAQCRKQLTEAERKVEILVKRGAEIEAEPFGEDEDDDDGLDA